MFSKINIKNLAREQIRVYTNEDGNIVYTDIILFVCLPILIIVLSVLFVDKKFEEILFLYQSVAFLSGFIFSALIVVLNISAILIQRENSRIKKATRKTIREIAVTSLSVFVVGIFVTFMGMIEAVMNFDRVVKYSFSLENLWHAMVLGFVVFIVLNLLLISKKLVSCLDDIIDQ